MSTGFPQDLRQMFTTARSDLQHLKQELNRVQTLIDADLLIPDSLYLNVISSLERCRSSKVTLTESVKKYAVSPDFSMAEMEHDIYTYIRDLDNMVRKQERITAELDVASRIQSAMLPKSLQGYKSEYGFDTDGQIIKYLYGTGSSWKGSIGEITVILENNLPYARPNEFELPKGKSTPFTRIADNKWEAHFYKIEPKYTDCITIHTGNILDDTGPKCFPSYFKFNRVKAEKDWLFWYTRPQLRIVRNALYALHGYNFKSADLKELFTEWGKYWYPEYTVNPAFTENELSDIEKYNIQLILTEEESRSK